MNSGYEQLKGRLSDWRWRLDNLYHIVDKSGKRVQFKLNWAQEQLFNDLHYLNVILKARQLGFTTFTQIFMLDACVFNRDIRAGTIAHTLDDAKIIFRDKVKYPYDQLPDALKSAVNIVHDNATELMLSNNSSIRVGTSLRSGTLQYLHISEYGKICAKYPEKAREVRTGALNTVQAGQIVFIESTAEGQEGHYYDLCQDAQTKSRRGVDLGELDFKFHFYPWWKSPEYSIDPRAVVVDERWRKYFDGLAKLGINLSDGQKAWYVKKAETQLDDMKREYPSTPEEAFEASVEGAYFAEQMAAAESQGRIGVYPYDPNYRVHTVSDIGMSDATSTWLFQVLPGMVRLVDHFEVIGEGMDGLIAELQKRREEKGYLYGTHYMPHDIRVREWTRGGLTRIEIMLAEVRRLNLGRVDKVERSTVEDWINAARRLLNVCQFNEANLGQGLKCLRNFKKDWDENLGVWKSHPRHDWASHAAAALGYLGLVYRELHPEPITTPGRILAVGGGNQATLNDLYELNSQPRRERV